MVVGTDRGASKAPSHPRPQDQGRGGDCLPCTPSSPAGLSSGSGSASVGRGSPQPGPQLKFRTDELGLETGPWAGRCPGHPTGLSSSTVKCFQGTEGHAELKQKPRPEGSLRGWAGRRALSIPRGQACGGHGAFTIQAPSLPAQLGVVVPRDTLQVWLLSPGVLSAGHQSKNWRPVFGRPCWHLSGLDSRAHSRWFAPHPNTETLGFLLILLPGTTGRQGNQAGERQGLPSGATGS